MSAQLSNLCILETCNKASILIGLQDHGVTAGHFTNGTYIMPIGKIIPTTLCAFEYVKDYLARPGDALVIAINSDHSMRGIMDAKNASPEDRASVEDQVARARKVSIPLALQHPDRQIVILFYDEETPTPLYDFLAENGFNMQSLHKWGFGTEKGGKRIEGAHNFATVLALPLPNDTKPVCYELTQEEDQTDINIIVKLTETIGSHGAPYITAAGELLFPLNDAALQIYGPRSESPAAARDLKI